MASLPSSLLALEPSLFLSPVCTFCVLCCLNCCHPFYIVTVGFLRCVSWTILLSICVGGQSQWREGGALPEYDGDGFAVVWLLMVGDLERACPLCIVHKQSFTWCELRPNCIICVPQITFCVAYS